MGESEHSAFGPPASLASSSITLAGLSKNPWVIELISLLYTLDIGLSINIIINVVRMWVQLRLCVSSVWVLQRGHSGDGCDLVSTLCKYDLRKGNLFVLCRARVQRVRWGSISSELLMCGGGVHSIFNCLLWPDA